jgi:adenine-specific DNA-methyltransferase
MLTSLLGRADLFTYPKSVYAVLDTLETIVGDRPDALIVDAFGGSGTTAHATALLNATRGGNRRCILITNNEVEQKAEARLTAAGHRPGDKKWSAEGVFEKVTRPRLTAAITGNRPDGKPIPGNFRYLGDRPLADGFNENIDFFELTYRDRDEVELDLAFDELAPLLWMQAGAVGPIPEESNGAGWFAPDGATWAALFDPNQWRPFVDHVKDAPDVTHAFVVTDSESTFNQICAELPSTVAPSMLYRDYLRSFDDHIERDL